MIQNKITIDGNDFELVEINWVPTFHTLTPTINFNNKFYIGKAIPNKPKKYFEILQCYNDVFGIHGFCDSGPTPCFKENRPCKIHSVKRLSDNEVFTVEDKISYKDHGNADTFHIKGFEIKGETIWVFENIAAGYGCILDRAVKHKEPIPLFYADGGETPIYKNEPYWYVGKLTFLKYSSTCENQDHVSYAYFSTEEKANEYVINNIPNKSINDIINCFDKSRSFVGMDFLKEKLIELTKEKLNK